MSVTGWLRFLSSLLYRTISKGKTIQVNMEIKVGKSNNNNNSVPIKQISISKIRTHPFNLHLSNPDCHGKIGRLTSANTDDMTFHNMPEVAQRNT